MGLASTTNRVVYQGDGTSATFSFPYYFSSQADLNVFLYDTLAGGNTPQVLNTNFTISGTPEAATGLYKSGGSVVFNSTPVATSLVVITRNPSQVQNLAIPYTGIISSAAVVNEFDYLMLLVQRLQDQISRAVILPDGMGSTGFSTQLPSNVALSPASLLSVNSTGTGFQLTTALPTSGVVNVTQISGILPTLNGGTNQSVWVQGQVVYASSVTALSGIPFGPIGYSLTSNGSSAPSWQAPAPAFSNITQNVVSKNANYSVQTTDNIIEVQSSGFTLSMYGALSNSGRMLTVTKTDNTVGNVVITCSNAAISGTSIILSQQFESVRLFSDGLNWQIQSWRKQPTVQLLSSNGNYVPSTGAVAALIEVIGAGGGGGGVVSGSSAAAGGGGGGGYALKLITNLGSSYPVIVGNPGPGGPAGSNNGQTGSSSIFGSSVLATAIICLGGTGGSFGNNLVTGQYGSIANVGGTASGGDINTQGKPGGWSQCITTGSMLLAGGGGDPGNPAFGTGPVANVNGGTAGSIGQGYGCGGSGASNTTASPGAGGKAGGNGLGGVIRITEFYG